MKKNHSVKETRKRRAARGLAKLLFAVFAAQTVLTASVGAAVYADDTVEMSGEMQAPAAEEAAAELQEAALAAETENAAAEQAPTVQDEEPAAEAPDAAVEAAAAQVSAQAESDDAAAQVTAEDPEVVATDAGSAQPEVSAEAAADAAGEAAETDPAGTEDAAEEELFEAADDAQNAPADDGQGEAADDMQGAPTDAEATAGEAFSLKEEIAGTDGYVYLIEVEGGAEAGVPAGTELSIEEITGRDYFDYLTQTADFLGCADDELAFVKFLDISLVNGGENLEPQGEVRVTIRVDGQTEDLKEFRIVHFGEKTELLPVNGNRDGSFAFTTDSFSVYAITGENGEAVVPRAVYHFYDGATEVGTQILKNQECLTEEAHTVSETQVFLGWFLYDAKTGSWGEEAVFGSPIQIIFGNEEALYGNSVVVKAPASASDADHADVVLKARYTTRYASVYFMTETTSTDYRNAGVVYNTVRVGVPSGESTVSYEIPDVTELSIDPASTGYQFVGWSTSRPSYGYYSSYDSRETVASLTLKEGEVRLLYPVFRDAKWMIFRTAPTGAGAGYVSPAWVMAGKAASDAKPADPAWRGYRFLYWTETPTFDENSGLFSFREGDEPEPFDFDSALTENVTLYAYWESGYTTYTVITWKQKVSDGVNAPADQRTYEFAEQEVREAKVGETVALSDADLEKGGNGDFTGFHHRADAVKDSAPAAAASGDSTVLNVYYDRDVITMKFYDGNGAPAGGYDDSAWQGNARCRVYTGLYGQSLADGGYSWPDGIWSYYNDENGTTGMSFLGSFVLPDGVRDASGTEIRLYRSSSSGTTVTISFYLQNEDGSYASDPTDAGTVSGGRFYFSEKYDGYTVAQYRRYTTNSRGAKTYYNASGKTASADSAWADASADEAVALYESGWFSTKYFHLDIRYARRTYDVHFYDPTDGQALTVQMRNGSAVQAVSGVRYGAQLSGLYPAADFTPDSKVAGTTFNGRWYADRAQTVQIFFEELTDADEAKLWYYTDASGEKIYTGSQPTAAQLAMTIENGGRLYGRDEYEVAGTMPMRNLAVYAGFARDWYWVMIDPDGGELNPGRPDGTDSTYFWMQYGGVIREYEVTRDYVRDDSGAYYYHYAEFNTADPDGIQPSPRRAYYDTDPEGSYDGFRYRRASGEEEGYDFAGWYEVGRDGSLAPYNFENSTVTGNTILRAVWKQRGSFRIFYSTSHGVDRNGNVIADLTVTGTAPADSYRYAENASVVVMPGAVAAESGDGAEYEFGGWYFNNSVLSAGDVFAANTVLVEKHPDAADDDSAPYDTFVLYPVFVEKGAEEVSQDSVTKLVLDGNGGTVTGGYVLPAEAEIGGRADQVVFSYTNLPVNAAVTLPGDQSGMQIFEKENAEFLGWAFSSDARTPVFTPGQRVGVDNLAGSGYNGENTNVLYAVWRMTEISVKVRVVNAHSAAEPLANAIFLLNMDGEEVLTSGSDGYLADENGGTVIRLRTPSAKGGTAVYTLTETSAPSGYQEIEGHVTICVAYDGSVTYVQDDRDGGAGHEADLVNGCQVVTVTNRPYPAPTGVRTHSAPFVWIFAAGLLLGAVILLGRKRVLR